MDTPAALVSGYTPTKNVTEGGETVPVGIGCFSEVSAESFPTILDEARRTLKASREVTLSLSGKPAVIAEALEVLKARSPPSTIHFPEISCTAERIQLDFPESQLRVIQSFLWSYRLPLSSLAAVLLTNDIYFIFFILCPDSTLLPQAEAVLQNALLTVLLQRNLDTPDEVQLHPFTARVAFMKSTFRKERRILYCLR